MPYGGALPEQAGGDGAGDHPVARRVHVQVIAHVVGGVDIPGVGRVADRLVEVEHGVELVAVADPGVDLLAGRLPVAVRVVVGVVAPEGRDRRAVHADPLGVRPGDDLLVGGDQVGGDLLLGG